MSEGTLFGEDEYIEPAESHSAACPATPGTGPAGETCKTCSFKHKKHFNGRGYWKCALMKPWSNSVGSDIRLKWPACRFWIKGIVIVVR